MPTVWAGVAKERQEEKMSTDANCESCVTLAFLSLVSTDAWRVCNLVLCSAWERRLAGTPGTLSTKSNCWHRRQS